MTSNNILPAEISLTGVIEDVELPCECTEHERLGHGDEAATWIVWQLQCCEARQAFGFLCDPCVMSYLEFEGSVRCGDCGHRSSPARLAILRIEPLSKRGRR